LNNWNPHGNGNKKIKMKRTTILYLSLLALALFANPARAQIEDFRLLKNDDATLYQNVEMRERLTDLVQVYTFDSVLSKSTQRHVVFPLGIMMTTVGMKWRAMEMVKQKYVGTSSRNLKMFYGIGKEKDYNFFLTPHLDHYADQMKWGFDSAQTFRKNDKGFRLDTARFGCPPQLQYKGQCLSVECENTPYEPMMEAIDSLFMPTDKEKHGYNHPNFHGAFPTVGLYGTYCLDCNHNCRPEIHPFDWVWWLDIDSANAAVPSTRNWYVGLIRDASKRFDDWTGSPISGAISIPFIIPWGKGITVTITELAIDEPAKPTEVKHLATGVTAESRTYFSWCPTGTPTPDVKLILNGVEQNLSQMCGGKGYNVWIEQVATPNEFAYGYIHLIAGAKNVFSARVTVATR
jgi:hypothetical protein